MADFYALLEIDKYATQEEIKAAYKRLARLYHPDKAPDKEEEFKKISEAYETLSDPKKRRAYDGFSLANSDGYLARYAKQRLPFYLNLEPNHHDHYSYVNKLFKLEGNDKLITGQEIGDKDELWEKLHYVAYVIDQKIKHLLSQSRKKPQGKIKEEIDRLRCNSRKIGAISAVLLGFDGQEKFLYDLTLDIEHTEEMKAIETLIGGRERLINYIKNDPYINAAEGIFVLRDGNCLTPHNFVQLISCRNTVSMSGSLRYLSKVNLLTQANIDLLMHHKQYDLEIGCGLARLKLLGILDQRLFEIVVRSGKHAKSVGSELEGLKFAGILNEENLKIVAYTILGKSVWKPLWAMKREGFLTKEHSDALLWQGPQDLCNLNHHLNQMVAHGLYLLSCDPVKGKTAMLLALELKQDLKAFYEKPTEEQIAIKDAFKQSFLKKLHSKDGEMSTHRERWKVILANVAMAFTGLGLFAIGVNLLIHKQGLFTQTKREKLLKAVEKSEWLNSSSFSYS
nr:DnaJ domain-containing protein [Legionella jordanis]